MVELIKNKHYVYVTERNLIPEICEKFNKEKDSLVLGVDIETDNTLEPREGFIRLLQLSNGRKTFLIDLKECFPGYWDGVDIKNEPEIAELRKLLEDESFVKVLHNAVFDMRWLLEHLKITLKNPFDSMLADQLIEYEVRHNLASVAKRKIGLDLDKTEQNTSWLGALDDAKLEYAAFDVHFAPQLYKVLRQDLADHKLDRVARLEFDCLEPMAYLQNNGIKCNKDIYKEKIKRIKELRELSHDILQEEFSDEKLVVQTSLFAEVKPKKSFTLNVASHQQVRKKLQAMGIPIIDKNFPEVKDLYQEKTQGKDLTEADSIVYQEACVEEIVNRYRRSGKKYAEGTGSKALNPLLYNYPVLKRLLEFRGADKMQSSYGDSMMEHLVEVDGHHRIFPSYRQIGAPTGRMSCRNPNIQQVSNAPVVINGEEHEIKLREAFDFPEGKVGINGDFSQIELRVLAFLSGDPVLLDCIKTNKDNHSITGAGMLKMDYEEFLEAVENLDHPRHSEAFVARKVTAKRVNFGVVYGIGPTGLAVQLNCTVEEAKKHIDDYAATYPVAWAYLQEQGNLALRRLWMRTSLGRRQLFSPPEEGWQEGGIRRNGMNMPIQGEAADIMKQAAVYVHRGIIHIPGAKLVSIVHDELTVEAFKKDALRVSNIIQREMVRAGEEFLEGIPVEVKPKIVESWLEAK